MVNQEFLNLFALLCTGCHADVKDDLKAQCDIAHDKVTACEEATEEKLNSSNNKTFQMLFFKTRCVKCKCKCKLPFRFYDDNHPDLHLSPGV